VLADWGFGSVIWAMIVFTFWVMAIWLFIALFADIFRRHDIGGWAKAGWVFLIFVLPFLGALIYLIARPKDLEVPSYSRARYEASYNGGGQYSAADEIAKLAKLRDEGTIDAQDYERLKARALA
jgi:hypothetical protein